MKEWTEKIVPLELNGEPETQLRKIEKAAEEMYKQGWYYSHCESDQVLSQVILFFERDIADDL